MFVIVLNSTNVVQDGENNKLVYKFPNSVNLKDKYVAVSSISMYYSWFNITSAFQNNYFTYTWTSGSTTTTYTILIPDGAYNISTINNLIQYNCIANKTYWINDSTGNYVYPFEFILDSSRYAVEINTYMIPIATPTGYSTPTDFVGWPSAPQNSVITIPAKLNIILGYTAGFQTFANVNTYVLLPTPHWEMPSFNNTKYQSRNGLGTISYISTIAPNVQPNNNVLFSLSGINNPYTQPSSIIYSMNPSVNFGELITVTPPNFMWNKFIDGTYNELRLTLLGTDLRPLIINDSNMTILLTIREKDELSIK